MAQIPRLVSTEPGCILGKVALQTINCVSTLEPALYGTPSVTPFVVKKSLSD